jgi:hypothetical protein
MAMVGFAVTLLTLAAGTAPSERDVLAYGKRLNVNRIDPHLHSERYPAWLGRTLGPDATITWTSDDCGESGGGYEDVPLCITAEAQLRPRGRVILSVAVGSAKGGLGGRPALFFGMIEGLGPSESIEPGDLPLLASKVRAAQDLGAELSRRPDVPPDDDASIRQIQRMPAARLVPGLSGDTTFGDWIATRAGPRAKVGWFGSDCGRPGHHDGPPVDLTGDKDEWAFVAVVVEDPEIEVVTNVRVGTCRKGMWGKAVASKAQLYDKRPGHIHIENVPLDVLEGKLAVIRASPSEALPSK